MTSTSSSASAAAFCRVPKSKAIDCGSAGVPPLAPAPVPVVLTISASVKLVVPPGPADLVMTSGANVTLPGTSTTPGGSDSMSVAFDSVPSGTTIRIS